MPRPGGGVCTIKGAVGRASSLGVGVGLSVIMLVLQVGGIANWAVMFERAVLSGARFAWVVVIEAVAERDVGGWTRISFGGWSSVGMFSRLLGVSLRERSRAYMEEVSEKKQVDS